MMEAVLFLRIVLVVDETPSTTPSPP